MRQRDRHAARVIDDDTGEVTADRRQQCRTAAAMDRAEPRRLGLETDAFASWMGRRDPAASHVDANESEGPHEMLFHRNRPSRAAALSGMRAHVGRVDAQTADGWVAEFQNVKSITKLIGPPRVFRALTRKSMQDRRRADCSPG